MRREANGGRDGEHGHGATGRRAAGGANISGQLAAARPRSLCVPASLSSPCAVRRVVSRILLVGLVIAVGVAVWRVAAGSHSGAVVAMEGLHAETLTHQAFMVSETVRLAIDAAGSFEERPDTALAALGWIVRRPDGAVVWRQRPGAHPPRGLVSAVRDTVELAPGTYDAYFASYGDPLARAAAMPAQPAEPGLRTRIREALSQGGLAWQGEAGRWHVLVSAATPADRNRAAALSPDDDHPTSDPDLVWTTGALGSDETPTALVRVSAPATVEVDAVLEAANGVVADSAALVRVAAPHDTLWAFRAAGSAWAGGSIKNRAARVRLRLAPGLYRLSAHTDGAHAAGDWTANPPWAPWAWGVRLRRPGAAPGTVAVFDAATAAADARAGRLPEIAGVRCVGTNTTWEARFTLVAPVEALLVAQGELSDGSRYDYATLTRDGADVWTMTRDDTQPAGGASRNRRAEALLALEPGDYRLTFETDGSHDCTDGFGDEAPDDASLWGVVLIAADPAFDLATVRRSSPTLTAQANDEDHTDDNGSQTVPETLVAFDHVGNDARLEASFTLAAPTRLHVVAQGELFPDEPLDYGWIEDASGERVWTMTRANTEPAGGAAQNRRFDGAVSLPAGRFTAHVVTNGRHATGDFGDGAPDDPDVWGLRIARAGVE